MLELGEFSGQGQVREPGNHAAEYLRAARPTDDSTELLRQLDTLRWHEEMGMSITNTLRSSLGQKHVICFDFSGGVKLLSYRGDAEEFSHPKTLFLFGAMFVAPKDGGDFTRHYFDVSSFDSSHASNDGTACLNRTLELAREKKVMPLTTEEAIFFSDKAKHFCSGEMAHAVLLGITEGIRDVKYKYRARYRGKTALGAHFSQIKRAVKVTPVAEWPNSKAGATNLVLKAVSSLPNTTAAFLSHGDYAKYARKVLKMVDISHVRKLRVRKFGNQAGGVFTVEDKIIPIRTSVLSGDEVEGDFGNLHNDLMAKRSVMISELCEKLRKQRNKLSGYRKI